MFTRSIPDEAQAIWFKEIIGYIYQQNKHRTLSNYDLQQLNKDTISFMISQLQLKQNNVLNKNISNGPVNNVKPNPFLEPATTDRIENKSNSYSRQFLNRQKEYEDMTRKPEPPTPVFQEHIEDTVIENMEELVNKHLKQRELDIESIAPINFVTPPQSTIIIDHKNTIELPVEELPPPIKHNVKFDIMDTSEKQEINEMKKLLQIMQNEINELKTKIIEMNNNTIITDNCNSNENIAEAKNYSQQNNIEIINENI
jgi:hypothetical protein